MTETGFVSRLKRFDHSQVREPAPAFDPLWRTDADPVEADRVKIAPPSFAPDKASPNYVSGFTDGFAAASEEAELRFNSERHGLSELVKSERLAWQSEEGARLVRMIEDGLSSIETRLRNEVAALTETWVMKCLEAAAVEEFVAQAERLTMKARAINIEIKGRSDLACRAAALVGELGVPVTALPAEHAEISSQLGATLLETRIQQVMETLGRHY